MAEDRMQNLLDSLGLCLCELTGTSDSDLGAVDSSLSQLWGARGLLKQRHAAVELRLAFLACTKSGKSTLINALVGSELLPMSNVPETAHICGILHDPSAVEPMLFEPGCEGLQGVHQGSSALAGHQGPQRAASACTPPPQAITRGEAAVRSRLTLLNQAARQAPGRRAASCCLPSAYSPKPSPGRGPVPASPIPPAATPPSTTPTRQPSCALNLEQVSAGSSAVSCGVGWAGEGGWGKGSVSSTLPLSPGTGGGGGNSPGGPALLTSAPPGATLPQQVLLIHTCVAALAEYTGQGADQQGRAGAGGPPQLQLLDTPGANEAGEEGLRWQVERLLSGVDACVYLLDYTKLKTQDEASLLQRLKQVNPALVRRLSQRFFFVVNKVDAAQTTSGHDLEATRAYVADLVTEQMGLEGFHLTPSQVVLVSARNALLSRCILRGNASPEARAQFLALAFGAFANHALITEDSMRAAARALLADSGVLDLESQVLGHLRVHGSKVKQLALADDLDRLLAEVHGVSLTCHAALTASCQALAQRSTQLQEHLHATTAAVNATTQHADDLVDQVALEVRAQLKALRGRLFGSILATLDLASLDLMGQGGRGRGQGQGLGQGQGQSAYLTSGWLPVRQRFLSLFTSLRTHPGNPCPPSHPLSPSPPSSPACQSDSPRGRGCHPCHPCHSPSLGCGSSSSMGGSRTIYIPAQGHGAVVGGGVGGGSAEGLTGSVQATEVVVARTRSRQEMEALLAALHVAIVEQVQAEVQLAWRVLEQVAAARHQQLLQGLNQQLQELSEKVQPLGGSQLALQLPPAALQLPPPDLSAFTTDLDQLLARGMVEARERHIRVSSKQVTERVLRKGGGLFGSGRYWETVPHVRTIVEAYNLLVYELLPPEVCRHYITMVDQAVDASQCSLEAFVAERVAEQVAGARQQLSLYSNSYQASMEQALAASCQGSGQRRQAQAQVQQVVSKLEDLRSSLAQLRVEMEAAVPHVRGTLAFNDLEELEEVEAEEEPSRGERGQVGHGQEPGAGQEEAAGQQAAGEEQVGRDGHGLQASTLLQSSGREGLLLLPGPTPFAAAAALTGAAGDSSEAGVAPAPAAAQPDSGLGAGGDSSSREGVVEGEGEGEGEGQEVAASHAVGDKGSQTGVEVEGQGEGQGQGQGQGQGEGHSKGFAGGDLQGYDGELAAKPIAAEQQQPASTDLADLAAMAAADDLTLLSPPLSLLPTPPNPAPPHRSSPTDASSSSTAAESLPSAPPAATPAGSHPSWLNSCLRRGSSLWRSSLGRGGSASSGGPGSGAAFDYSAAFHLVMSGEGASASLLLHPGGEQGEEGEGGREGGGGVGAGEGEGEEEEEEGAVAWPAPAALVDFPSAADPSAHAPALDPAVPAAAAAAAAAAGTPPGLLPTGVAAGPPLVSHPYAVDAAAEVGEEEAAGQREACRGSGGGEGSSGSQGPREGYGEGVGEEQRQGEVRGPDTLPGALHRSAWGSGGSSSAGSGEWLMVPSSDPAGGQAELQS